MALLRVLVRAAHPGPTVAVTALALAVALGAGVPVEQTVVLGIAVLLGQLSIGWSNDVIDADRDLTAGRRDKPLATARAYRPAVRAAAVIAAVLSLGFSLALGPAAGGAQLLLVASGWAYNVWLKRTAWSWLPYAVGFGALPCAAVLAAPGSGRPAWWLPLAGALLGVGAHLLNALPDLADDAATGVRGLPHRLGAAGSAIAAAVALLAASLVVALGPPGPPDAAAIAVLLVALVAAAVVVVLGLRRPTPWLLLAAVVVAGSATVLMVGSV